MDSRSGSPTQTSPQHSMDEPLTSDGIHESQSDGLRENLLANKTESCYIGIQDKVNVYFTNFNVTQSTENIIAWFWGAFVLFMGIIFVVAQYTTTLKEHSFIPTYWLLFGFMFLSIIGMSIAIRHRGNHSFVFLDEFDDEQPCIINTNKYLLGNAYVFAIGNFVIDIFAVVSVFHCGLVPLTTTKQNQYAAKFVFHFVRVIFYSLQLLFLQIFVCTKIHRQFHVFLKILIVHNVAVNILIWFTFVCQDTGVFLGSSQKSSGEFDVLPCSSNANDTVFDIARDAHGYLSPFIFEFSILVAALFYCIYPVRDSQINERGRRKYNYGAIDTVKRDESKVYKSDPGILFGLLIILLLAIASWCIADNAHYIQSLRFAYVMQIIVQLLICFSCVFILREMRSHHTKETPDRKYTITDYLLLFTGLLGFLPFLLAVLFSVTKHIDFSSTTLPSDIVMTLSSHVTEVKIFLVFICLTNIVSVFIQLFTLLTVQSYKRVEFARRRRDSSLDMDDIIMDHRKLRSSARIGQWVLFLMILNLGLWITNSFFEMRHDLVRTYATASVYWHPRSWMIITKFFYPLLIFFRFHSVAILLKLWICFRVKRKLL